jgi:hypothetical protein
MRHEHEYTLMTVVVRVYAPTSWTDQQGIEALTGLSAAERLGLPTGTKGWDFAVKELPRIIQDELDGFERDLTMPEGLRFEVTS